MKACNQCGKCCQIYGDGLSVSADEVAWWETFRPEIAEYVRDGKIWISPETGEQLTSCPWLRKHPSEARYSCAIYHDRPDDCRHYPVNIDDMVRDECEMIEVRDLTNPARAQQTLDRMMIDSRPAKKPGI